MVEKNTFRLKDSYMTIFDLVHLDLDKREDIGTKEYGVPLKPFNGRDALWDAYEEALDLVMYLRQAIYERDNNK